MALMLTDSQELQLLQDQDVDSMMTLLTSEPQQDRPLYNHEVFEQQLISSNLQHSGVSEITSYSAIPDLVPTIPSLPVAPCVLTNEDYAGPFNFEVLIDPHHGSKNPWVYSGLLNKLFIAMANPFPIDFKWSGDIKNLYVRATPLFSLAQHSQELVTRCIPHSQPGDSSNRNVSSEIWDHVIRCQSANSIYLGNKETNVHLNVIVPLGLPQTGTDCVRILYSFMCKNSCPSGMNRKPFEVIFTLEDDIGSVLGRRKISVRVCSCPKRDKEKEEKDYMKDGGQNGAPQPGKKRKIDKNDKKPPAATDIPLDTEEYVVNLKICGKDNMKDVLKFARDRMAGFIVDHGGNENVKRCKSDIENQLKDLD